VPALLEFVLHFDRHLLELVQAHGPWWIYGFLFLIVFAETGFVVTPFLPGDSLLFAAGALVGPGVLEPLPLATILFAAAFLGNTVNYAIGRFVGPRVFHATDSAGTLHRLLNREHLTRAHRFFERYGGKAVILARFVPIVRTFVPFVAGAARMTPQAFAFYNFIGAAGWVGLCIGAGVLFGNVPVVKDHFSLVTLGIVAVSLLPIAVEFVRHRLKAS
jgi:membrane-associated protein